jgi:hypothetical protein
VSTSVQTSLEVLPDSAVREAPEQSLLPPIRREDGKLLPGAKLERKRKPVAAAIKTYFNGDPEKLPEMVRQLVLDCFDADPDVRHRAMNMLFDRMDGKPTRVIEDDNENKPSLQRPVINIIIKD